VRRDDDLVTRGRNQGSGERRPNVYPTTSTEVALRNMEALRAAAVRRQTAELTGAARREHSILRALGLRKAA
jgi:hypothetical protein